MLRLFLGLAVPADARDRLAAWAEAHLARAGLRPVPAANLHVTLVFCGAVADERLPDAVAALELVPDGFARALAVRRLRAYGSAVALELAADAATAQLQAALAARLATDGLAADEGRPWSPHLTLARAPGRRGPRVPDLAPPADAIRADAVVLYASRQAAGGVRYEALASSSSSTTRRTT